MDHRNRSELTPLTPLASRPIPEDFAPKSRPRGRKFPRVPAVQRLPMARLPIAHSAPQAASGRSCPRDASAPRSLPVLKLGANEYVDRAPDLLRSSLADLTQAFVDGVLDRLGA